MKSVVNKSVEIAGRTLSFEVGRLAQQATASVLAKYGESVVLAAVVVGREDKSKDYFPLSVEYQERLYAGGRIKGSRWVKRERNTDEETLSARLIDRSIRPLFPKDFKNEVQVIVMVLASDTDNDTDVLGINAVSAALAVSPIPWNGPIGSVRMGWEDGKVVVNPANGNRPGVDLDLVVSSTDSLVTMLEAGANQIPDDSVLSAIKTGFEDSQKVIGLIKELVEAAGKEKLAVGHKSLDPELVSTIKKSAQPLVEAYLDAASKKEGSSLDSIITTLVEGLDAAVKSEVPGIVEEVVYHTLRKNVLDKSHRLDGRKLDEIRPLSVEVGVLPRVHGSAVFQRGQTQALTVTTLGSPTLGQILESAEGEETKRYMHHYNFPPFSTGETGRVGSPKRREIGHGALAERGLAPVIPSEAEFPYAIRVVSEILSSNGSSSMASTCGSTLSLMDAGVPIKAPVSGISIGLVTENNYPAKDSKYLLLTDIIGLEDHYGDMDFKIAGTETGITAIQLDTKVPGLTMEIVEETFKRSRSARMEILKSMLEVIPEPRKNLSTYAPKIRTVKIPVDKIGELIGPGGKNIKKLMAETLSTIDVEDDGAVFVSGPDEAGVAKAMEYLSGLAKEVVVGETYIGTVARMQPFGAFVNILPGKDGLVHVSQMAQGFVQDPSTILHEGQSVKVWVTEIDDQGRINLSMLFDDSGAPVVKAREERPRQERPAFSGSGPRDQFNAPRRPGFDRNRGPRR
jgi:polyribonucleotide nucleotidyltransferase